MLCGSVHQNLKRRIDWCKLAWKALNLESPLAATFSSSCWVKCQFVLSNATCFVSPELRGYLGHHSDRAAQGVTHRGRRNNLFKLRQKHCVICWGTGEGGHSLKHCDKIHTHAHCSHTHRPKHIQVCDDNVFGQSSGCRSCWKQSDHNTPSVWKRAAAARGQASAPSCSASQWFYYSNWFTVCSFILQHMPCLYLTKPRPEINRITKTLQIKSYGCAV